MDPTDKSNLQSLTPKHIIHSPTFKLKSHPSWNVIDGTVTQGFWSNLGSYVWSSYLKVWMSLAWAIMNIMTQHFLKVTRIAH